ncbi:ABC transporter ATP-binding protein [Williamsoniiplasma luminosum]|uniref:ABC transporter ATP-binding protein n=1 Tax=Williamsoniiplasma luminosum TaxID=214888 RepID=A0A2K8NVL7_9MOLU|nr:ATP-binding cassette domain-containing protein [Williamsoniiplasma luminosum]ATZ16791.1 ABC transporter ATP-binding protein [Williamsoniiplasma luminosum]
MIKITNLTKDYGPHIGNFCINLSIQEGKTYGIVGPNGAGKTTLIRQLLGFIKPTSGDIHISGIEPWKKREEIMQFTGYIAGEISLYDNLTGLDYLKLVSKLKKETEWSFVETLLKHFELDASRKIKKMSKGMKQKIAIIAAVMNKPRFLVLDEPTSGLDPVMQDRFNELINKLRKENHTTIIICSHIFEEVIKLSDYIGFIKAGELIEEYEVIDKDVDKLHEKFKTIFATESVL